MRCSACGEPIEDGAELCLACGEPVVAAAAETDPAARAPEPPVEAASAPAPVRAPRTAIALPHRTRSDDDADGTVRCRGCGVPSSAGSTRCRSCGAPLPRP